MLACYFDTNTSLIFTYSSIPVLVNLFGAECQNGSTGARMRMREGAPETRRTTPWSARVGVPET